MFTTSPLLSVLTLACLPVRPPPGLCLGKHFKADGRVGWDTLSYPTPPYHDIN